MPCILVIETDTPLRDIIARTLTGEGHEVLEAQSGADGLQLWHARGADLVLTDVLMPGTGGVEVILELHNFAPTLPIVAMPGVESGRELCELLGAVTAALPPGSAGGRARTA